MLLPNETVYIGLSGQNIFRGLHRGFGLRRKLRRFSSAAGQRLKREKEKEEEEEEETEKEEETRRATREEKSSGRNSSVKLEERAK